MGNHWGLPMASRCLLFYASTEVGRPASRVPKPRPRKRYPPSSFHPEDSFIFQVFLYNFSSLVKHIFTHIFTLLSFLPKNKLLMRLPGLEGPRLIVSQKVVTPLKNGVQVFCNSLKILDSGACPGPRSRVRRNDETWSFSTFYELVKVKQIPGP
jgi:hypothetical protein